MRVLLLQLDGKLPNLALMRLSAHHKALGDEVVFQRITRFDQAERGLFDQFERVYGSLIFDRTRPLACRVRDVWPWAIMGGTGWDCHTTLERYFIRTREYDYSIYPEFPHSIGFTQRGCRLRCQFCVVPVKEGAVREEATISELWRGVPHPRNIILLDNDFFGQPKWRERIEEIRKGDFKVCFTQGINARMLTNEAAQAIASVKYCDDQFRTRRIYTAWDNRKDEERLFAGLNALVKHGVKPDHIMVYMLIGYWPGETEQDREHRRAKLREFGCRPYPMPYARTPELVGFQRWVVGAYDKRVSWQAWKAARYQPSNLGFTSGQMELYNHGDIR